MDTPPLSYFEKMEAVSARSQHDYGTCEKIVLEALEISEDQRDTVAAEPARPVRSAPALPGIW